MLLKLPTHPPPFHFRFESVAATDNQSPPSFSVPPHPLLIIPISLSKKLRFLCSKIKEELYCEFFCIVQITIHMQIFVLLCPFLTVCFVVVFDKLFLKFLLLGFVSMECRCLLFENFKQVYSVLGLILLFDFLFKIFYAERFSKVLIRILCDLRWKWAKLKYSRFCSKNVVDGKFLLTCGPLIDEVDGHKKEKLNSSIGSEKVMNTDSDEEFFSDEDDDDGEFDVLTLRKLLMIERCKVNAALAELAKERAAYSSAADEAMAMILRIQREKSVIEMESSQFRRLAEEKQIHDQEVIRSLQWMVWDHESKRRLLEDQLRLRRSKMKKDESEEFEEDESFFRGNILDALENVLYSSRDANNLLLE